MKRYIIIAVIAFIVLYIVHNFLRARWELYTHSLKVRYDDKRAKEKKRQEELAKKKKQEKYSRVKLGNPILEAIVKFYNIIVFGGLGAGKTLFANLLVKYLFDKYAKEDKKNKRYNKYMKPDYIEELMNLKERNTFRVCANLPLENSKGKISLPLWPYLTQQKRAPWKAIYFSDEIGEHLGKELYYSDAKYSPEVQGIIDSSRFNRQNRDIKWIGTEQSRDNVFKPIRDRGFAEIQALRTYVGLTKYGKRKRSVLSLIKFILPGFIGLNIINILRKQIFISNKIKVLIKSILPGYFLLPREYYLAKTKLNSNIKKKHTYFKTIIDLYGDQYMFKFNNKKIFKYKTNQNEDNYLNQFDKNGDRVYA